VGGGRVAGVIGHPISHSLSPAIHNAAFRACGLEGWTYAAFDVPAGGGGDAVRAVRALGLAGLSVTMPLKEEAAAAVDRLSPVAAALDALNTVWLASDGVLAGDSTDGQGFLDSLRADHGVDVAGRRAVVLGAGGAARAVVLALAGAGAAEVAVVNRTRARAEAAAALAGAAGTVAALDDAGRLAAADLVVNATPLGMAGVDGVAPGGLPVDPLALRPGQVVVDLVYRPLTTPLLRAASDRGARPIDGLGTLVHQAAHQFRLWTGLEPPVADMFDAARQQLRHLEAMP
jgi:shikimate dehydrogenase